MENENFINEKPSGSAENSKNNGKNNYNRPHGHGNYKKHRPYNKDAAPKQESVNGNVPSENTDGKTAKPPRHDRPQKQKYRNPKNAVNDAKAKENAQDKVDFPSEAEETKNTADRAKVENKVKAPQHNRKNRNRNDRGDRNGKNVKGDRINHNDRGDRGERNDRSDKDSRKFNPSAEETNDGNVLFADEISILREEEKEQETSEIKDIDYESIFDTEISDINAPVSEEVLYSDEESVTDEEDKKIEPEEEVEKVEIIGIRFRAGGKMYYFDPSGNNIEKGKFAIVDTARGNEFGEVCLSNTLVPTADITLPLRPVIRVATEEDIEHNKDNKRREEEAFGVCLKKIQEHELDMKLVETQFTFDNSKLLFYFTSAGRVDFRDLVKDLASVFRTRIELRQIGIRDEAKLIGGLGICGRPVCCSKFLSDFNQVSIKMAKEQNLSLNFSKISGCCGRLMCCLNYEYDTYREEISKTPPVDSFVNTPDGNGFVVEISPLAATVKVKLKDNPDVPPKTYLRDEVKIISRSNKNED